MAPVLSAPNAPWQTLVRGVRATLPVGLAVAPFGLAYGAAAGQVMAPWQALLMSGTVFAGTAQFIAVGLLAGGAAPLTVLATGLLLNLRLLLMSAALAARLGRMPRALQLLTAHLLTDESFAVTMAAWDGQPAEPLLPIASGLTIYVIWIASTAAGLALGAGLPGGLGLEFALPASLICLLFLLVRDRASLAAAGAAAVLALALRPCLGNTWTTLVAASAAAAGVAVAERARARR